jgi:drug/metabolite transporter (DMT)-like permease
MIGLISATSASFLWAIASILYKNTGTIEHPLKLNFLKGIIAFFLLGLTALISKTSFDFQSSTFLLLSISGAIGIGIGDTAFFHALKRIGAQQTLVIGTLAPGITLLLGSLFLAESLSLKIVFSIFLSIVGIMLVLLDDKANWKQLSYQGYVWAALAMIAQAVGILLSRLAMKSYSPSPLSSAMVRLFFGIVFILAMIIIQKRNITQFSFETKNNFFLFLVAVILGTTLTMWLQQYSLKFLDAGIAQTLLSTSPVFIAVIQVIQGYKIKFRTILGIVLALIGVSMLFLTQ